MNITYVRDDKIEFKSNILDGLQKYNKRFTGETHSEIMNVYITENDKIIGGCQTELEWNWVYIEALYYEDEAILKAMLYALYKYYHGHVEGLVFESYLKGQIKDLLSLGFKTLGTFEDKPKGHKSHILVNQSMIYIEHADKYNMNIYHEKAAFDEAFEVKVNEFNALHHINQKRELLQYIAYDGDKIIGGVNGNLSQDYLYISLLWVEETYRGHHIASKLMDLIEDEAKTIGYNRFFLGTCTFQAKEFYEKRGYRIKMVVPNCPKGFDDFTMTKLVK